MKLTYDPEHNIGYILLREKDSTVETIAISDEMNVDLGADGTIYGIELLNANEQLKDRDDIRLVVENIARGESNEYRI